MRLWRAEQLYIEDGVFFADGRSYAVDLVEGALRLVERVDLAALLAANPGWVTELDLLREVEAPGGLVVSGEGSHGSEGFFARLDAGRNLVWVCYLSEANPFLDLRVVGSTLTATSTSGARIEVDLDAPLGP